MNDPKFWMDLAERFGIPLVLIHGLTQRANRQPPRHTDKLNPSLRAR